MCYSCYDVYSTLLRYRIVNADGRPSASPRVEVDLGLIRVINSCRAGGGIVERLQSWQRRRGDTTIALGAPAVEKLSKPGDPSQVQIALVVCLYQNDYTAFKVWRPHVQRSAAKTKEVCDCSEQKYRSWRCYSLVSVCIVLGSHETRVPDFVLNPQ